MLNLEWMDEAVTTLWQGKGIDTEAIVSNVNKMVESIVSNLDKMKTMGIEFPMEYVSQALKHFQKALETRDSYLLADCLKDEIKEIAIVYNEIMVE